MVTVTPEAAVQFKRLLTERNLPEATRVRVGLEPVPGEQESLRLFLAFDSQPVAARDEVHAAEGIEVVIEKQLAEYLSDMRIDFVTEEGEEGDFVLRRPDEPAEA
jgi:Fe-S cluster assembly iron-binding protein IscA